MQYKQRVGQQKITDGNKKKGRHSCANVKDSRKNKKTLQERDQKIEIAPTNATRNDDKSRQQKSEMDGYMLPRIEKSGVESVIKIEIFI